MDNTQYYSSSIYSPIYNYIENSVAYDDYGDIGELYYRLFKKSGDFAGCFNTEVDKIVRDILSNNCQIGCSGFIDNYIRFLHEGDNYGAKSIARHIYRYKPFDATVVNCDWVTENNPLADHIFWRQKPASDSDDPSE